MPRLTLDEIKAKADEYANTVKALERAETAREQALAPTLERHAEELHAESKVADRKIARLEEKADRLRAEVFAWLSPRKKTYVAESEKTIFGVEIGTKELERQPDKAKLWKLCKKKGVEFFDLINVMLGEADKRLGNKEIDAISERRKVPRRDEYLKLK